MKFTEAKLEQAFIELLGNEGYPHHLGNNISRKEDEVIIEADLSAFLKKQYQSEGITDIEIQTIIHRIQRPTLPVVYHNRTPSTNTIMLLKDTI